MPGHVQIAVVDIDKRRLGLRGERCSGHPLPQTVGSAEARAAQPGRCEPRLPEPALSDHGDRHPGSARPLEHGRMRLVRSRIDRRVPLEGIQQCRPARDPGRVPEHTVSSWREPGAKAGEARRCRRRAPNRDGTPGERGQERRLGRVGTQQVPPQAVDQQHAVPPGRGQAERVVLTWNTQCPQNGRQQLGQGRLAVPGQDQSVRRRSRRHCTRTGARGTAP